MTSDPLPAKPCSVRRGLSLAMLPWMIVSGLPLLAAAPTLPTSPAPAATPAPPATPAPAPADSDEVTPASPAPPVVPLLTPAPQAPASPAPGQGSAGGGRSAGPAGAGSPSETGGVASNVNGRKIAALEFKGLKTLSEETLLYYLGLEIGQTLDEASLNRAIKSLWDRGLVDDLRVDYSPAGTAGGVKLTIIVQERPILKSIDYEGLKRLSKTDIQDKIATQRIKVHEGEPMSLGELQRVKTLIEDMYREKGFRFAQASYTVQDLTGNDKKVVFKVDEGDRVRIAKINFTGNHVIGGLRLRFAMKDTKESNIVYRLMKKDVYDPAKLQEDLDKVRDLYHSEGYKNVAIGEPTIEVKAKHPNAAPKDQQRRMFITIPVEENDRWTLGQISLDGNKIYPDAALMRAFSIKPGAWLRSKVIEDQVKKVTDTYHNTGYVYARVDPEMVERPGHVADLVVHISEGEQFKVGRIEFSGNDRTRDKVLRREVRLYEGGLVNIAAVKNSVIKINQLGYFKLDEEDPVDIETNSEKKEVNLVFKGREANRTELQFGGGWSEIDGFFVQFSVSTKNFLGRGEQVGVSVQTGRYRKLYDFTYSVPWWRDKPQSIGFRAFDSDLDYQAAGVTGELAAEYIQKAKGVTLTYGRNLGLFNQASIAYTYSRNEDSEGLLTPLANGTLGVGSSIPTFFINTSSIKPGWSYDSRNDPFEPVRGLKMSASLEYGGGPLGGNDDFLRPDLGFSVFAPVTTTGLKTVFAFNAQAGMLHSTSGRPLSPLEYFFLGGENSIRGMRFRSVTVRDDQGNPIFDEVGAGVGGDKFLQYNIEYHFLAGGPFRIVLFNDGGNVFGCTKLLPSANTSIPQACAPGHDQSFDLSHLRYTAGVELRVLIPLFGAPLRFIYSKNLRPEPFDEFETFQFSIGTSF
jgi:outer membrane protein insertion porin family